MILKIRQESSSNRRTASEGFKAFLAATTGTNQIAGITYNDFADAERLAGDQRIALDSYAVITSPTGKEYLQTTPVVANYPVMIWDKLTNPKSSTEVTDNRAYTDSWSMLPIAIWADWKFKSIRTLTH